MKYALINGKVLSGHIDMQPEEKTVLVENEKISGIVDKNYNLEGYEIVDLDGQYLLPGLINMHVHIPASGKPTNKKSNYDLLGKLLKLGIVKLVVAKMCEANVKQQLLSGTTTIRAVGGIDDLDTKLRDKINAHKAIGPRILAANYAISVPGGHMTGTVAKAAESAEEAVAMVDDIAKSKPDLIKLMITGGVLDAEIPGEPGVLKMPASYVKAVCDRAHELGLPVAAHVEGTEGLEVALENGVDTIEHGGKPNDKVIELFKEKGAVLIATLSPALPFALMDSAILGLSETDLINGKALFTNMTDCIAKAMENNITVGLGTDTGCPYTTHYDTWRELYHFTKYCNVSNAYALHTATMINAKIAGIDKETGSIEVGKSADMIVTKENPLEDLKTLRNLSKVIFKGEIINNPKPKKYELAEKNLDLLL